ncbi:MAG: flavodoxin-dependent (E)-4-hydroxy-3-methylbut-2-enyl-diphosphate synthase, partial [Planctomycetota bacterium]
MSLPRNPTRAVRVGSITIGDGNPIAVQSMTATKTLDLDATIGQIGLLLDAGADVIRVAADSKKEAAALIEISKRVEANLSVDLQESYKLAEVIAPHVAKMRYNPGHLFHFERSKPWQDKVRYLADVAGEHDCAMRVGVNCGSV